MSIPAPRKGTIVLYAVTDEDVAEVESELATDNRLTGRVPRVGEELPMLVTRVHRDWRLHGQVFLDADFTLHREDVPPPATAAVGLQAAASVNGTWRYRPEVPGQRPTEPEVPDLKREGPIDIVVSGVSSDDHHRADGWKVDDAGNLHIVDDADNPTATIAAGQWVSVRAIEPPGAPN